MGKHRKLPFPSTADYSKDYRRGWAAEEGGSETALERADMRNESDAWYDGYLDSSAGRPFGTSQVFGKIEELEREGLPDNEDKARAIIAAAHALGFESVEALEARR